MDSFSLPTTEELAKLSAIGFLRIDGMHVAQCSPLDGGITGKTQVQPAEDDLGTWSYNNSIITIVTVDGQVWVSFLPNWKNQQHILHRLCPSGQGVYVPFPAHAHIDAHSFLRVHEEYMDAEEARKELARFGLGLQRLSSRWLIRGLVPIDIAMRLSENSRADLMSPGGHDSNAHPSSGVAGWYKDGVRLLSLTEDPAKYPDDKLVNQVENPQAEADGMFVNGYRIDTLDALKVFADTLATMDLWRNQDSEVGL